MNLMLDAHHVNIIFQEKKLYIIKLKCEKPIVLVVVVIGSGDLIRKWEDTEV